MAEVARFADGGRGNGVYRCRHLRAGGAGLDVGVGAHRTATIRTVWIVESGAAPRLVTAYPLGEELMIKEHDRVVLTKDLVDEKLAAEDVGTVVHV